MMMQTFFKAPIFTAVAALGIAACQPAAKAPTQTAITPAQADNTTSLPPIRKALACLPPEAAMIAAHRGTDETRGDLAENAVGSLEALIDHGILVAEIDVAGLKDGTLISYHDGVWDEVSTGKGPVASSTKADLDNILLRSRKGELTAERPPLLLDMIRTAKDRIYLEIDFKSSAKIEDVIKMVRTEGVSDQVVLIAYNPDQAAKLARLAPEMLRSNPTEATERDHAVWLGYGVANGDTAENFKAEGNYIIGRIGDPNRQPALEELIEAADLLVTDEAFSYDGIVGMTVESRSKYEACLSKG